MALDWFSLPLFLTTLVLQRSPSVSCHLLCPYGFQFDTDQKYCVVSCEGEKGTKRPNIHCEIYSTNDDVLRLNSFQSLTDSVDPLLPPCYNPNLTSAQYSLTADGNLKFHPNIPPLMPHNVNYSVDDGIVDICFPLSPQLLQCDVIATQPWNYQLINGTELLILSSNVSYYLGDFYVMSNGTALSCHQSIRKSLIVYPRCHYVTVTSSEYVIHSNNSLFIPKANLLIKRPVYSYKLGESDIRVCVPLDAEFINCQQKIALPAFSYIINQEDLTAENELMKELLSVDSYFLKAKSQMVVCVAEKWLQIDYNDVIVDQVQMYLYVLSAICLLTTFVINFKFFTSNYISKCLFYHMICLTLIYTGNAVQHFGPRLTTVPCYVIYVITYFSSMAAFFWLNVIAYDSMRNFVLVSSSPVRLQRLLNAILSPNSSDKQRFIAYNIYAWLSAAILTLTTMIVGIGTYARKHRHPQSSTDHDLLVQQLCC
ncbi:hypothetical protein CHUAL_008580 [Chamberlinius hualienensis]